MGKNKFVNTLHQAAGANAPQMSWEKVELSYFDDLTYGKYLDKDGVFAVDFNLGVINRVIYRRVNNLKFFYAT